MARLAAAAAVALTGVTAPPAMGANVVSDRDCYREGETAGFLGTGFQPNQPIAISVDGRQIAMDTSNDAGNVEGGLAMRPIPRSEQVRQLSMTQTANPALTATRTFRETKLYVVTKPNSFRPGRQLRIRAGGFYGAGRTLYGHVRGPRSRNLRIGRVKGPCGKVSATRKVILKRGDGPGTYVVQYDTVRRYRGLRTKLQFRGGYTIRRLFRRSSSFSSPVFGDRPEWVPDA